MKIEYFVFVTNNCNLNCQYCSVLEDSKINKFPLRIEFDLNTFKNFVLCTQKRYTADSIDIIFFGGEPSLDYKYLYEIIDDFGDNLEGYPINYFLHTNGLLLDKIEKKYLEKLRLIILSINYLAIPKFNLFNSYFGRIINNIKYVKSFYSIPFMARLTIGENVSLYTHILQISNFFDYIYWQIQNCTEFKNYNLFYKNYSFELDLTWDYWIKYLENGYQLNFLPFMSLMQLFINSKRIENSYLCGYNKFSIYVQTDGKCYSCSEEIHTTDHFYIGNIRDKVVFGNNNVTNLDLCKNCPYLNLCQGRCGRMQERFSKTHIQEYCKLNELLFRKIIDNKEKIVKIYEKYPHFSKDVDDPIFKITEYVP